MSTLEKISEFFEKKDKKYKCKWRMWKAQIKWFFQKKIRGWSDEDMYDLDAHLAGLILPRLKYFRKYCIGQSCGIFYKKARKEFGYSYSYDPVPESLGDDKGKVWKRAEEMWGENLDEMIEAFELIERGEHPVTSEKQEKIDKGLKLFKKYMQSLWF